jgi:pectate lyase
MIVSPFFILNLLVVFCLASPAQPPAVQDIKSIAQKGYAGANPPLGFGETTGGQGGKIFKVTTDAELQNAIHVRYPFQNFKNSTHKY